MNKRINTITRKDKIPFLKSSDELFERYNNLNISFASCYSFLERIASRCPGIDKKEVYSVVKDILCLFIYKSMTEPRLSTELNKYHSMYKEFIEYSPNKNIRYNVECYVEDIIRRSKKIKK